MWPYVPNINMFCLILREEMKSVAVTEFDMVFEDLFPAFRQPELSLSLQTLIIHNCLGLATHLMIKPNIS